MPIHRRPADESGTTSLKKEPRETGRARIISSAAKGSTSAFDETLKRVGGSADPKQLADPFKSIYDAVVSENPEGQILAPPLNFNDLTAIVRTSNILPQCIESYRINIDGYGHVLEYVGPEGSEDSEEAQRERSDLETFLASCSPNHTEREVRERARVDLEQIGNQAYEVSRDTAGRIVLFDHIDATTIRKTRKEKSAIDVDITIRDPINAGKYVKRTIKKKFCRYVQISSTGQKVWFKEFGDPRPIDPSTGKENPSLPIEEQATEVLYMSLYSPGCAYGYPRWIGQLPVILGSRESELVNLNFFKENAIPAMVVLVSGGALSQESFELIEQYIQVKGQQAMHRMLVLEATADDTTGSTDHAMAAPKIDMKPMISERQQDGLFQEYDQKNQGKVRSSFRLPPIYTGRAEDYTRASAFASMLTAENQIFQPERVVFDALMNDRILSTYMPVYWRYKSLGPALADPETMSKMLDSFEKTGALTPNAVIKLAKKMLDVDIKPIMDAWGDYPFAVVMEYVRSGATIEGMDEFIGSLPTAPASPDPGADAKPASTKAAIRKVVQSELAMLRDDLVEAASEAAQSVAEGTL